ncbi:class I SAM-dependent methyltransferase [Methylobacterium currus]|uniref:Class I SAM-dependent methyltransferase n=1 Tax=Methylobacterium currus TaxID=2051553 RepID=A0A2R4WNF0_9HYPH|nr:class I SAM-dependent methyltransferase [Methylobacterium currus]AWB23071.1 class I SAM-dependent methyltransferase [Methylobacterium currus]
MPPDAPSTPDDDRPPVLAHERFLARREAVARLSSLTDRFRFIYDHNLWGSETSASGLGSEAGATRAVRDGLPGLLGGLGVATLLDAPCGDAGWMASIDLGGIRYVGADIVADLIVRNRIHHPPRFAFHVADITQDALPRADAILCRDCLVHLSFANIDRALANFRRSGARWLVTTTFTQWQHNRDCEDGDWRALNFEREPFAWGPPARLLNERCDEGGGGWRDKSLAVWDLGTTLRPREAPRRR